MKYAGFWVRAAAFLIDFLVTLVVVVFFSIFIVIVFFIVVNLTGANLTQQQADGIGYKTGSWFGTFWYWVYFSLMESSPLQATLGKRALKLKVVDEQGRRIGFWRATARFWSKYLSFFSFFIGFLMVGITQKKQGLHDKIAKTLVAYR